MFKMCKKKELLIISVFAVQTVVISGFHFDFPLRIAEPVFCVQMIGAGCYPFRILWANVILDLLFWFVVWAVVWWVAKWMRMKRGGER